MQRNGIHFHAQQFNLFLWTIVVKNWSGPNSRQEDIRSDMGRSRFNVCSIWNIGPTHMVGIFMGYHGASNIFCYIWHCHGRLRLLLLNQTGKWNSSLQSDYLCHWSMVILFLWPIYEQVIYINILFSLYEIPLMPFNLWIWSFIFHILYKKNTLYYVHLLLTSSIQTNK